MATENYFTNYGSSPGFGEKTEPGSNAQEVVQAVATTEVAVADDNGSTYLLFKSVPSSFRLVELTVMCDAITGGTDYDIGVYNAETGVVVDKDLFMDGQTLATASRALNGLGNVNIADIGALKTIAELLGLTPTTAKSSYDIVLTGNTVGTAAGTVTAVLKGFSS